MSAATWRKFLLCGRWIDPLRQLLVTRPSLEIVIRKNGSEQPAPSSRRWLKGVGDAILDLLFPPRCVACHRLGAWLCTACLNEIEAIRLPVCPRCGWPVGEVLSPGLAAPQGEMPVCDRCQQTPFQLDGLRACAFHSGPLREAIHQLKYEDVRSLAAPLGKLMGDRWQELGPPGYDMDAIVPVPLHASRQRERGYNQAALLARVLGAYLRRPVVENALIRVRATAPQVGLSADERRVNVRDAFRCVGEGLRGKQVLLVDDVCTTGSTLEAACSALKDGGVSSVWAYTLARAR